MPRLFSELVEPVRLRQIGAAVLLLVAVLAAYQPCLDGAFIWDDDVYVSENRNLTSVDGLIRSWTDPRSTPGSQYYPLVYTSFWIEYQLWGLQTYGYHLSNVLIHGLCAVLFWTILRRLGAPWAYFAGIVFALHPVCVESAAWITERKNVLSMFFATASLLAYLRFEGCDAEAGAGNELQKRAWSFYGFSLVLFVCALLSKTVTTTLPVVILLLLWWRHGRLTRRRLMPLAPMVALGLALAALTISVEGEHMGTDTMEFFQDLTLLERGLVAGRAAWFYAGKILWPANLSFIYPQLAVNAASPAAYLYPLAVAAGLALLWALRRRVGRGPLTGVLVYLVVVGPALGFFDIAQMRFSLVADHWVYHASTAILALVAAGFALCADRLGRARAGLGAIPRVAAVMLVPVLFGLTWQQCHVYQSLNTLWQDVIRKNPNAWIAQLHFGILLCGQHRAEEALPHLEVALSLEPGHFKSHHAMGNALFALGRTEEAIAHYRRALEIHPHYATAMANLGTALRSMGRTEEAMQLFEEAAASEDAAFAAVGQYHIARLRLMDGQSDAFRERFDAHLEPAAPGAAPYSESP